MVIIDFILFSSKVNNEETGHLYDLSQSWTTFFALLFIIFNDQLLFNFNSF